MSIATFTASLYNVVYIDILFVLPLFFAQHRVIKIYTPRQKGCLAEIAHPFWISIIGDASVCFRAKIFSQGPY